MKKIYLAGSCSSEKRTLMTNIAKALRDEGLDVYCPFELKIPNAWDMSQEEWAMRVFDADIEALNNADTVFVISPGRMSSAGTNWEQGYAYALDKTVIVFQYMDADTSLMTYAGCSAFINTTIDNICNIVVEVAKGITVIDENCSTILT